LGEKGLNTIAKTVQGCLFPRKENPNFNNISDVLLVFVKTGGGDDAYNLNIVESGLQYHKPNQTIYNLSNSINTQLYILYL
jgi:hypothetical protein